MLRDVELLPSLPKFGATLKLETLPISEPRSPRINASIEVPLLGEIRLLVGVWRGVFLADPCLELTTDDLFENIFEF